MFRFSTRSQWEEVQRAIATQKFHATLKPRLDCEIEDWHQSQPPAITPPIISEDELRIRAPWVDSNE